MSADFDPYREWLGLDASRPVTHYQLLGLNEFEADAVVIASAADSRMRQIRAYQTGPRGKFTQKILNEIASAKLCLLDAVAKQRYDATLRPRVEVQAPVVFPPGSYLAEPPLCPPPAAPPVPLPPGVKRSVVQPQVSEEGVENEPARWWLPLLAGVGLIVVSTLAAGAFLLLKKPKSKVVEVTPQEATEEVSQPTFTSAAGRKQRELDDAVLIMQEGNGDLNLPMEAAELEGNVAPATDKGKRYLTDWDQDSLAAWKIKVVRPAIFKVQLVYVAKGTENAQWQLEAAGETKEREITASGQFVTDEFFWRITKAGEQELILRARGLSMGAELTLESVRLFKQDAGRVK